MKTKILSIKYTIIATTMLLLSCGDDLIKNDIDNDHAGDPSKLPAVTIASPENITYEGADIKASWSNAGDEIIEAGVIYSLNESFTPITGVSTAKEVAGSSISITLGLVSETNYFVKAYAQTKSNGIAYSNVINLTTLKAPVFEDTYLFGTYMTEDIDIDTGEPDDDPYEVKIAQSGTYFNRVSITNIWGGGRTIEGIVDFEKKTITIARTEVIYIHSSYGNCNMYGLVIGDDGDVAGYSSTVIATYDEAGNIEIGPWAPHVSAGDFAYYIKSTLKKK